MTNRQFYEVILILGLRKANINIKMIISQDRLFKH